MTAQFQHTVTFDKSVSTLYAAITSEEYWKDRMAQVGGPGARLAGFHRDGDLTIELIQGVNEDKLPGFVRKIRRGNLEVHRTETWGDVQDDTAKGTFVAKVHGTPAKIGGTTTLRAEGAGSAIVVDGEVEVRVPLLGPRVEPMIADQLDELMQMEDDFTREWLDARG